MTPATSQRTYTALLEHEIVGHRLTVEERLGMKLEIERLTAKMKQMGGHEEMLLARYRKALKR